MLSSSSRRILGLCVVLIGTPIASGLAMYLIAGAFYFVLAKQNVWSLEGFHTLIMPYIVSGSAVVAVIALVNFIVGTIRARRSTKQ